jgi:dihydroneopterin aldolase
MSDVIRLVGMSFYAYHGDSKAERDTGRQYEVDCDVYLDTTAAGTTDALTHSIDYSAIHHAAQRVMLGKSCNLLETLAARIARTVFASTPAKQITVRVRKLAPPVKGCVRYAEVEVTRSRRTHTGKEKNR